MKLKHNRDQGCLDYSTDYIKQTASHQCRQAGTLSKLELQKVTTHLCSFSAQQLSMTDLKLKWDGAAGSHHTSLYPDTLSRFGPLLAMELRHTGAQGCHSHSTDYIKQAASH